MWLVSHKLDHLVPQSSPRKSGSSYRSSEDTSGRTNTTSSGFGSSQATGSLTLPNPRSSPEKRYRPHDEDEGPSQDDGSPSKMLRKAFFNAPTGNSLSIPEPTPPPMSPNPADVIGAFMQHHLAIHSPQNTPAGPAPLGLGVGGGLPFRNNISNNTHHGATPTPMHTPESPQQLQNSLRQHPSHLSNPTLLHAGVIPLVNPVALGSILANDEGRRGGGGINNVNNAGMMHHLESFIAHITHNNQGNNNQDNNNNGAGGGAGNIGGANNLTNVISTGVPIYPSRVIETEYLDPSYISEEEKHQINGGGGGGGREYFPPSEPVLGRGARSQLRKMKQGEGGEGHQAQGPTGDGDPSSRPNYNPNNNNNNKNGSPAGPVAPAPPGSNLVLPPYATSPRPTAGALAQARAASAQHHVDLLATQLHPLHFPPRSEDSGSLDLARVFDYGDYSPGGGLSGFTPLQRSPGGGGSGDWVNGGGGGGVDSITFSFGGDAGGRGHGPHCSPVQENETKTVIIRNEKEEEVGREEIGDKINIKIKKKNNLISDASTEDLSYEKTGRDGSPPPEMLDVVTAEGEAAAEEAGNKATKTAGRGDAGGGGVKDAAVVNNPLFGTKDNDTTNDDEIVVVRRRSSGREAAKKAAAFLAAAAKADNGGDGSDAGDDKEKSKEISSGSSNLGDNEDNEDLQGSEDLINGNKGNEYAAGLRDEDSGTLIKKEKGDVRIKL
jgi:hypothetical protein